MKEIIKNLTDLGNRQNGRAYLAYKYLNSFFKKNNIAFTIEKYQVNLPRYERFSLYADEIKIPCLPTGLSSGKINDNSNITTSLISSRYFLDIPHISFNPKSEIISRANFSFAPSLAISRASLLKICNAKKIKGELLVKKKKQTTYQLLVGNTKNPKSIVFSHFDSIGTGAIDNASGTAVMIDAVVQNKEFLRNNLFVFDGNEEISYDYPIYWGKGYRNFEKKYRKQMKDAEQLIVVDCVGYAKTDILSGKKNSHIIKLAFPIRQVDTFASKIRLLTSDYNKLMSVYHSDLDRPELIKKLYLKEALRKLLKALK